MKRLKTDVVGPRMKVYTELCRRADQVLGNQRYWWGVTQRILGPSTLVRLLPEYEKGYEKTSG